MNKKSFTDYEIRQELANYATAMFSGASQLTIHYQKGGAFVYARFADKVREYAYVAYETICAMIEQGQHGMAMNIIGCDGSENLPDSINYNNY